MNDALQILKETPASNLLIALGAILLILSVIGRFGTFVEIPAQRQGIAGVLGGICLALGLATNFWSQQKPETPQEPVREEPAPPSGSPVTPVETPSDPTANPDPQPPAPDLPVTAPESGWFVVLGAFLEPGNAERRSEAMRAAGFATEIIESSDYHEFAGGYSVVVMRSASESEARAMLAAPKVLIDDAYVRYFDKRTR